ncbi:hypothetical protein FJ366_01365 [Candidatus Dependentiae bacterium]|nr:hypothetical protein [Candidatus Dependentiae bacterium]
MFKKILFFAALVGIQQHAQSLDDGTIKNLLNQPSPTTPQTEPATVTSATTQSNTSNETQATSPDSATSKITTLEMKAPSSPSATPIFEPGASLARPGRNAEELASSDDQEETSDSGHFFDISTEQDPSENIRISMPRILRMPNLNPFSRRPDFDRHFHRNYDNNQYEDDVDESVNLETLNKKTQEARADLDKAEAEMKQTNEKKNSSSEFLNLKKAIQTKKQADSDYNAALEVFNNSTIKSDDDEAFNEYQRASFRYSRLIRILAQQRR